MSEVSIKIIVYSSTLLLFHTIGPVITDNKYPGMTTNNYGKYNLEIFHLKKCKGPKSKELARFDYSIVSSKDKYVVTHNFTFHEQGKLDEVKITIYTFSDKAKRVMYNYRIQKPCQHFVIAETIRIGLKAPDCLVKKGIYTVVVDYFEYARTFFGKAFFYGEYELKVNILSSKGNIMCFTVTYNFKKLE